MEPIVWNIIRDECEKHGVDPHEMLKRAFRSHNMSLARVAAMRRVRQETKMSMPKIASLFNVAAVTVWNAMKDVPSKQLMRDEKIIALWNTMSLQDISRQTGLKATTVRAAANRLGLPPLTYQIPTEEGGHRAFTPRCAEILREHGIFLSCALC